MNHRRQNSHCEQTPKSTLESLQLLLLDLIFYERKKRYSFTILIVAL